MDEPLVPDVIEDVDGTPIATGDGDGGDGEGELVPAATEPTDDIPAEPSGLAKAVVVVVSGAVTVTLAG